MSLLEPWRSARQYPGWLSDWSDIGLSVKAQGILCDFEDSNNAAVRAMQKQWVRNYKRPEVDPAWARERRKEFLTDELANLKRALLKSRIELARENDIVVGLLISAEIEKIAKSIGRYTFEFSNIDKFRSDSRTSGINQDMIDKARAFPIRDLIKAERDMVSCPLHQDRKPSASIKTGILHCFSCGENLDSIGYVMQTEGLDFVSAVRRLQ